MKASKGGNRQTNAKKTRKQLRKVQRQQKKARRNDYYTNRRKPGAFVLRPPNEEEPAQVPEDSSNVKTKKEVAKKDERNDQQARDVAKEKKEEQKLLLQMKRQRKKQMVQANEEEDRNIKFLEKQLKLNKGKRKTVPKSFASDGLDYLLEVCDGENMKTIVMAEQQLHEGDAEFEEDIALMTGKSSRKTKNNPREDNKSDMKSFLYEDDQRDDDSKQYLETDISDRDDESNLKSVLNADDDDSSSGEDADDTYEDASLKLRNKNKMYSTVEDDLKLKYQNKKYSTDDGYIEKIKKSVTPQHSNLSVSKKRKPNVFSEDTDKSHNAKKRRLESTTQDSKLMKSKKKNLTDTSVSKMHSIKEEFDHFSANRSISPGGGESIFDESSDNGDISLDDSNYETDKIIDQSGNESSTNYSDDEAEENISDDSGNDVIALKAENNSKSKLKTVSRNKRFEDSFDDDDNESGDDSMDSFDDDDQESDDDLLKGAGGGYSGVVSTDVSVEDTRTAGRKVNKDGSWEDIYGRTRDKDGNVVNNTQGKYIPPSVRAKMESGLPEDKKRIEKLNRLKRQLKGLLNRLAETNMHSISNQVEELYMQNSRFEMNDALTTLIMEALVSNVVAPERLLLEHVLLITILHANVGTEVGAHFLQTVIRKFDELFKDKSDEGKHLDNVIYIISQLYNFKVFHSQLLYQVLARLSDDFTEKNVECILCVLKSVGFTLRKDDPLALKELILDLQRRAANTTEECNDNPRVKFMLEILLAIKNNNMNKIPNYDTSYSEHLKKIMKGFIRKGNYITQLNISLEDLLKADERGKWWVVGSAWTGKVGEAQEKFTGKGTAAGYSQKLLDLAKKQRMNTDIRRNIFCILMSAEDYLDAFEKLLHVGLKNQQEREIVHVMLHCCLQEKHYNPYYSFLAQKFCDYDRRFQMTIKYSIWDKLKTLTECSGLQISNLAKLLTHLFLEKGLPISILKVVQFGDLDKVTLRFVRQILLGVLLHENPEQCQEIFERVANIEKLRIFRERLRLFIHHFLLRNIKAGLLDNDQTTLLEERSKIVDRVLTAGDKKMKF